MRGRFQDFCDWTDLARAVAATLVVVSHVRDVVMVDYPGQKPWLPFYAATGFGHSAVIVFFVLSGFWISRSVLRRIDRRSFWPAYLIDRLSRLGIVLVPALVLGGLLDVVGIGGLHLPIYQGLTGAHSVSQNIAANLTLPVFLGNLAFLQTIAVAPWGSNGPLWSVAWEFWYYIWFPALVLLIRARRLSLALLALAVGLANPALYAGFACWLVGWALLRLTQTAGVEPMRRGWVWAAVILFGAVLLGTGMIRKSWTDLPLAISFGLLLLALARGAIGFPRALSPIADYGRTASFSLYASHFPIVVLVGAWLTGPARLAPGTTALLWVLALTAVCLLAGRLFARGSEAFTPQLRAWLHRRLPVPALTGGA